MLLSVGCDRPPPPICSNVELDQLLMEVAVNKGKQQPAAQEAPPCDSPAAPFADDQYWLLHLGPLSGPTPDDPNAVVEVGLPDGATFLSVSGAGTTVYDLSVGLGNGTDSQPRRLCHAFFDAANQPAFTLDGYEFRLDAELTDSREGTECSVRIAGTVEPCPSRQLIYLVLDEFALTSEQKVLVCGHELAADPLFLYRSHWPAPCRSSPTALPAGSWHIALTVAGHDDFYVVVMGIGDTVNSATVSRIAESGAFEPMCRGEPPVGTVTFDGAELVLDLDISAETSENGGGVSDAQGDACTLSYRGSPTECTINAAPIVVPGVFQVLEFEGAGQYARGTEQAAIVSFTLVAEAPDSEYPFSQDSSDAD
ncbi:MAG: hypothetical protein HY763_08565 [Planctomycetes bacterium]|nr:hypothetical protein [Planctomycetota bacterium]